MRIARVVLHNVKSYAGATTIDLAPGINAVCGQNGAGKSTILEAIGFALFGYRPYKLDAFLREGEKSGSITVTVEDDDGCSFDVVRKLGSGAGHAVYDELGQRIAEGQADVRNWLQQLFRLEPGTEPARLFEDTVGPPQGTLTAIFLESPEPRAKKFDRLLGIEDYREAAQGLRSVSNLFKEQAVEADRQAALLEGDVRRLPEVERRQLELIRRRADLGAALDRLGRQRAELSTRLERQDRAQQAVRLAESELELARGRSAEAQRRLGEQAAELRQAEETDRLVEENRSGYRLYQEAQVRLRQLDARRKDRDRLRQEAEAAARTALKWEQGVKALEERLAALARDEARAAELALQIPEQEARERAVRQAEDRVRVREEAVRQLPAIEERLRATLARLEEAEARLAEVEAARPDGAVLEELRERDRGLREELARLEKQGWELKQAAEALAQVEGRLRQCRGELQQLGDEVERLRALRPAAILAAERQRIRDEASGAVAALEARYQEAHRTRGQVEGGLCPFLHEPCRNLRPGVSLDGHFDEVMARTAAELVTARASLAQAELDLKESRSAEGAVSRLPDLEPRIGQLAEEQSRLEEERGRLERLCSNLAAVPQEQARIRDALAELERPLAQAETAAMVVSGEAAWRAQAEAAAQARQTDERLRAEMEAVLEREAGAAEALASARRALSELGDPRGEAAALRQRISRERPEAERALERGRRESAAARAEEERCRRALEPYSGLEEEMAAAAAQRDQNEPAHALFLKNQGEANRLPQRREAHQRAVLESRQAAEILEKALEKLEGVRSTYDEAEQLRLRAELEEVTRQMASGQRELELCQREEGQLLQEANLLRRRKEEMEAAQAGAARCRRYMEAVEAVRRVLDDAGPEIARALLRRISARATVIYRDLLGQPAVSLEWGGDYEIRCRIRAEEREFKQLSGGEQMAAALAVRLALLQIISNLRLAFLDEPTAHMDAERRANLAAQIQNLRSFDQLVVISHDDSFDTLFGHVVRLAKKDGATVVEP